MSNTKNFIKLSNDVIKYVIDKVCDHFEIKHFEQIEIIKNSMRYYTFNKIIIFDNFKEIFEYKDEVLNIKIYKPKFDILKIFEEMITYETYKTLIKFDMVIKHLEYYNMNYKVKDEIWVEKMIRDIYAMF